jgi:hypothetical protein
MIEMAIGALLTAAMKLVVEGAAKKTGEESANAGIKLLSWMREKLTGRAKEALEDFDKDPSSEDNQVDLRKQLRKQLELQPGLVAELQSLIPPDQAVAQTINQIGNQNRAAQVDGVSNKVSVS